MRDLKATLENHPYFLILTLILAILGVIFLFIELNDNLKWNLI